VNRYALKLLIGLALITGGVALFAWARGINYGSGPESLGFYGILLALFRWSLFAIYVCFALAIVIVAAATGKKKREPYAVVLRWAASGQPKSDRLNPLAMVTGNDFT
jgi:hypothetical protein